MRPRSSTGRWRSTALLGVACAAACGPKVGVTRPAPAGVIIQASTQRYPITGSTLVEIGASLRQARAAEGGFTGHYNAQWRWSYRYLPAGGGCRLTAVRIDMQSIIRVPDWRSTPEATDEVRAAWERYSTALEDHEREHERIAIDAAGDLVRTLERMQAMNCNQLSVDANREGQRTNELMQQRQVRFDADTRHGATTGARWPPPVGRDSVPG